MIAYKNNMGKELFLKYTASTAFYLKDKLAGNPWITRLHFPVHCVSDTETRDKVSGWRFATSYKYHHGYYDHSEKEFRGFGMIEQTDSEHFEHWEKANATNIVEKELHQKPVISKTWFHTGAFFRREKILNQFAADYWYEVLNRAGFLVVPKEHTLPDAILIGGPGIPPILQIIFLAMSGGKLCGHAKACNSGQRYLHKTRRFWAQPLLNNKKSSLPIQLIHIIV
jgi:hypothetical protein